VADYLRCLDQILDGVLSARRETFKKTAGI
jgi:hypothetical protein